jgi:hypothetical protein
MADACLCPKVYSFDVTGEVVAMRRRARRASWLGRLTAERAGNRHKCPGEPTALIWNFTVNSAEQDLIYASTVSG